MSPYPLNPPGPSTRECLLWRCWIDVVRWRASHQFASCPSPDATSPSRIGSLTIYKVFPTAEPTGNQLSETQDTRNQFWNWLYLSGIPHRYAPRCWRSRTFFLSSVGCLPCCLLSIWIFESPVGMLYCIFKFFAFQFIYPFFLACHEIFYFMLNITMKSYRGSERHYLFPKRREDSRKIECKWIALILLRHIFAFF